MKEKKIPARLRFKDDNGNDFPEWEEKKLGEIFTFRTTNSFSRDNLNYEIGSVKNIHYGDIHTKFRTHFNVLKEIVPYVNENISIKKLPDESFCKEGDVIIADASEDYADIGKSIEIVNLNNEKVISGLHTLHARPYLQKVVVGFCGHLMKSENLRFQLMTLAQGTKVLSITTGRLSDISISLPSLAEQTKIANFLSAIDEKIENLEKELDELKAYKKGVMQAIFSEDSKTKMGGGKLLVCNNLARFRFKDDDGNEFPEWEVKKLGEIGEFKNGINKSSEDFGFGFPFINLMNVFGKATISNLKLDLVNANEKELKLYELKKGDVLFIRSSVKKSGVGETSLVMEDLVDTVFSGFLIRFRDTKIRLDLGFKKFCFAERKFRENLIALSTTSANTNINQESLNELEISIPCLAEQTKIANFLSAIDEKIEYCGDQIGKTEQYKKGLLQEMFV